MDKKKKKIIRYSVVIGALVLIAAIVLVTYGNRGAQAVQYKYDNYDEMEFNPFITNEERLDNSFLEYGKVLSKYASRDYKYYTGDPIKVDLNKLVAQSKLDKDAAIVQLKKDYEVENVSELTKEELSKHLSENDVVQFLNELEKIEDSELMFPSEIEEYKDGFKYKDKSDDKDKVIELPNNQYLYVSGTTTTLEFELKVETAGLYSLYMEYLMLDGRDSNMLVNFSIDGKHPFLEASNMALKRMFGFYDYEYDENKDVVGNQIRPKSYEKFGWQNTIMSNPDGLYRNPYRFYMQKGTHIISLTFTREAGVIKDVQFIAPVVNPTYEEYKNNLGFSSDKVYNGDAVKTELEVPDYSTTITARMETDNDYYTSSLAGVPPYEATLFNIFGGSKWAGGGDTVSWTFNAPQSGWYELGFRYKSMLSYVSSFKEVRIDGEIPFAEMEEYCFSYADGWLATSLLDENQNPYLFYFEEGTHTITLTNKVGPLRHSLQKIEESMDSISALVNKIVKITASTRTQTGGYTVDKNRDYDLQLYIPTIQKDIKTYISVFDKCYKDIIKLNGGRVTAYASAVKVAQELFVSFDEDLEKVAISLNDITNAQTGLSNTMVSIKEQPIAADYMVLAPSGYGYPNVRSNSWQSFYVSAVRFFNSFDGSRYENSGAREGVDTVGLPSIEVYVSRGREHVDIMRNLVSEQFTPEYGIKVNINMVAGSSEGLIMPRYVAGTAPDVAISISPGNVFEFAIRGALLDVSRFETTTYNGVEVLGFEDLWKKKTDGIQSYHDQAFVPYLYQGKYYAFPETQNWSALFYRTDIFETLGLQPPDTWNDIYEMLPTLTNNGYNFCYNYGVGGYTPFLYQHGGDFYDADAMKSALNTEAAYEGFMEFANLYNQYNFVYAANFYMRFKSGEMPVGIADMAFYQQLNYSAPELNGKWAMTVVPGHIRVNEETGESYVDRSLNGIGTCCIIVNKDKEPEKDRHYDESWAFLQWWLSDSVQTEYGREVEATFGVASRWNPANMVATQTLPYTQEELDVINAQWAHLKESPNTMGGYYTSRYLLTALNQAVIQGLSGRIALEDAVKEINKEMRRKQAEFGIPEDGSILYPERITSD